MIDHDCSGEGCLVCAWVEMFKCIRDSVFDFVDWFFEALGGSNGCRCLYAAAMDERAEGVDVRPIVEVRE